MRKEGKIGCYTAIALVKYDFLQKIVSMDAPIILVHSNNDTIFFHEHFCINRDWQKESLNFYRHWRIFFPVNVFKIAPKPRMYPTFINLSADNSIL